MNRGGVITLLEAYFDESERTGGMFCVAGYVFAPEQARKFSKEWSRLFAATGGCHMVDLTSFRGGFKGMSLTERNRLLKEAVQIINKRISFAVSVSCNVAEVDRLTPKWIRGFGHAYPVCCYLSMFSLAEKLSKAGLSDRVTYIFEAGHPYEAEARDFIKNVTQHPEVREACAYHADAFMPKADAVPLQAADLLAWEWTKFRDETLEQRLRPIRQSLLALVGPKLSQFGGYHITGPSLAKYFQQFGALGLLQLQEEREEKEARRRV